MSTRCIIFGTSNQCADVADARRGTLWNCLPNVNASVTLWRPARVICYLPQRGDHIWSICAGVGRFGKPVKFVKFTFTNDPNVETSVRPRVTMMHSMGKHCKNCECCPVSLLIPW